METIPLMIVGDSPADPTGLGRIARDLAGLIISSDLPVDLVQIGGTVPPVWPQWAHYPLHREGDWGAACVVEYWRQIFGSRPGVLWVIWDPSRLVNYMDLPIPVQKWTYTAVDSTNIRNDLSGPAAAALQHFDRVLGYGRWASKVLKSTTQHPISYLPHGLELETFSREASAEESAWVDSVLGPQVGQKSILVGMVATNQPRKDLGWAFQVLKALRDSGTPVYGWLHTDVLVKSWAVQQLVEDLGLRRQITVTTEEFSDRQMALLYQRCKVTLAPGLGEGFGYPIAESLAAGVPVVHVDYGGGAELVPKTEWRVPVRAWRLEGCYALKRPVLLPEDGKNAILRVLAWQEMVGVEVAKQYCMGAVAHLDWSALWPRWSSWIRKGLDG